MNIIINNTLSLSSKFILFTLLLTTSLAINAEPSTIRFLNYNFDPLVSMSENKNSFLENDNGKSLYFIQFTGATKQSWLNEIKQQSIEIIQYYPDNTYLVWGATQSAFEMEQNSFVRWVGAFAKPYRVSPNLTKFSGVIKNVNVHFYNSGDPAAIMTKIKNTGAVVLNFNPAQPDKKLYDAIIQIDSKSVAKIIDIPEVISASHISSKPILDGESSSQTNAGNLDESNVPMLDYNSWLSDIGLDGSGIIWSITDSGVDYDHPDLNSRIVGGFSYAGCTGGMPGNDTGGHGTHVAGITGGDAMSGTVDSDGFLYGLGVAPAYSIFTQNPICPTSASWPPNGGWQELSKQALIGGAIGSNNSWTSGEGTAHGYQATERAHDVMAKDGNFDTDGIAEEFIMVFSAGNSGPGASSLTSPKEAKNIIVTAGTQTQRVSGDVDAMYNSSSRGPAVDGRYVPTIAAPGQSVASTRNDGGGSCGTPISGTNGLYSFCTGTSMASPHTSGSVILISQWWRQNNEGKDPSVAMAKALLINTATDIFDGGPIPNFNEGWGRVNLSQLFQAETPFEFYDQETIIDNTEEVWETSVGVVDPTKPVKITLVWSDAPGAIGSNPALVNDLDLEVDYNNTTYLGNNFESGTSVTGGTTDQLNNMENVYIDSADGFVTIRVKGTNVAGDGVFFSGDETDQNFALVCSNCAEEPDFTISLETSEVSVCVPEIAQYPIGINSILNYEDPVTFAVEATPVNANAEFSVNPVTPVGNSVLTISNSENISVGNYLFNLTATSTTGTKIRELSMNVFDAIPSQNNLSVPVNKALDVNEFVTFEWVGAEQAISYTLEIDNDSDFSSIEYSATETELSHTMQQALDSSTVYYWRVKTDNSCGSSQSEVYSFTTLAAPGDCALTSTPITHFEDDVESGKNGWSSNGTQNTWEINGQDPLSGDSSWHAIDVDSLSDQRLVSPVVQLPSISQSPITLQYFNDQSIESTAPNCWDGGILEISTDAGVSWNYVENDKMLTDPYEGNFSGTTNPLTGQNFRGWCGDPQSWTKSVVNLDNFAGQSVQFRFRLGTDGSVGRAAGWKIDDIKVRSCQKPNLIYANGFEANNP